MRIPQVSWTLAALCLTAACGEPTAPEAAAAALRAESGDLRLFNESSAAWATEADRLSRSVGERAEEQPLRSALRIVRDQLTVARRPDARGLRDASHLVGSYRAGAAGGTDPAELDAISLLITAINETLTRRTP